jgi:transcriptional regulator with GAF, ATPase, and Fis domain
VAIERGRATGERYRIAEGSLRQLLGKSEACDIRLEDAEVSRRHASFEVVRGQLKVVDLESTNGTFVSGVRVMAAFATAGQEVVVGQTTLRVENEEVAAGPPLSRARSFGDVIGESVAMRRLYPLFEKLTSAVPVLVEGETGTGKEVLAESIHQHGPRAAAPFVVLDCTAVTPSLMEAELFGHERGAFTGASTARPGVFEQAHGGTLLIDEIGDLDMALQPKLLRAIERMEVRRIGARALLKVDVRILAATRRDLDRAIEAGRFRDDLFHRFAVARVELPPLRDRWGDVPLLARRFWTSLGGSEADLTSAQLTRWNEYAWPGNVRELRNAVLRQLTLGDAEVPRRRGSEPAGAASADPLDALLQQNLPLPVARRRVVDEFERRYLTRVLTAHGGDTARAAAASGIARRYFQMLRARREKGK